MVRATWPFEDDGGPDIAGAPPEPGVDVCLDVLLLKVGPVARPPLPGEAAGVVLEGTGAGHVPSVYHPGIAALVERGTPVVLSSRCRDVERPADRSDGVLRAGDLTAEKAALALMVGLGRHPDIADLRPWWAALLDPDKRPVSALFSGSGPSQ